MLVLSQMKLIYVFCFFTLLLIATQQVSAACGAEGSCHGFGGGELCNDRCKRCSGPTGKYKRGACCGTLKQACCCYYS
uniref:Anti-biotic-peptide 1 n=1 Tax=Rhizopus oligosporus TaxID=4847 RepID=Q75WG4_RHIOL|nr:anti-biotic-peptide 1 [Rhizopus microsporus var. oligosporus]